MVCISKRGTVARVGRQARLEGTTSLRCAVHSSWTFHSVSLTERHPACPFLRWQEWRIEDLQGQVSDLRQEAATLAAAADAASRHAVELGEQLTQRGADLEAATLRTEDLAAQVGGLAAH